MSGLPDQDFDPTLTSGTDPAPEDLIRVSVTRPWAGTAVVHVAGEVDMFTGPLLRRRIGDELAVEPEHLVLDLSEVVFLGSNGLSILVDTSQVAAATGTNVWLVATSTAVTRPLTCTGVSELFPHHATVTDALAAAALAGRQGSP